MDDAIRKKGLLTLGIGFGGALLMGAALYFYNQHLSANGRQLTGPGLILIPAVLGGVGMQGLLQAVTGRPFSELADAWEELAGWQRGLLGFGVVAFLLTLLILFMAFVLPSLI